MNEVVVLEVGHLSWNDDFVPERYIIVDSVETGMYLMSESLKEFKERGSKIKKLSETLYIISQKMPDNSSSDKITRLTTKKIISKDDVSRTVNDIETQKKTQSDSPEYTFTIET